MAAIRRQREGSLTDEERRVAKALLGDEWRNQDIIALINIGREHTTNIGRISEIKRDPQQQPASESEVAAYIKRKQSYDYQTGLNLYDDERIIRAREAMTLAVHVFNGPSFRFKTELFCVNSAIAWTYVLHEHYKRNGVQIEGSDGRTLLLTQMIKRPDCPLSLAVRKNIEAVSSIRDEVTHKILRRSDYKWFSLFQACCLNFDSFLRTRFGERTSLGSDLAVAIQFSALNIEQIEIIQQYDIPPYIEALDASLAAGIDNATRDNLEYQFRVVYTLTSTSKGTKHIQFIRADTDEGKVIHNVLIKEKALDDMYPFKPKAVVAEVQKRTRKRFTQRDHLLAWRRHNARPVSTSKSPDQTKKEFCIYHKAHGDYTYSQKWIDFLVTEATNSGAKDG